MLASSLKAASGREGRRGKERERERKSERELVHSLCTKLPKGNEGLQNAKFLYGLLFSDLGVVDPKRDKIQNSSAFFLRFESFCSIEDTFCGNFT